MGSHDPAPAYIGRHGPVARGRGPAAPVVAGITASGSQAPEGLCKAESQAGLLPDGTLATTACHLVRAPDRWYLGVALVVQTWISITLNRAYTAPYSAYESVITLLMWFMAFKHLLAAILGLLLFGRIMRGRIAGHEYLAEAAGYWWYYTVVASLLMWLFALSLA